MNTLEAYALVQSGSRVGVVVTNAKTGDSSAIEIDDDAWKARANKLPGNTNYVVLERRIHGREG